MVCRQLEVWLEKSLSEVNALTVQVDALQRADDSMNSSILSAANSRSLRSNSISSSTAVRERYNRRQARYELQSTAAAASAVRAAAARSNVITPPSTKRHSSSSADNCSSVSGSVAAAAHERSGVLYRTAFCDASSTSADSQQQQQQQQRQHFSVDGRPAIPALFGDASPIAAASNSGTPQQQQQRLFRQRSSICEEELSRGDFSSEHSIERKGSGVTLSVLLWHSFVMKVCLYLHLSALINALFSHLHRQRAQLVRCE
jgi:hypothetical protein